MARYGKDESEFSLGDKAKLDGDLSTSAIGLKQTPVVIYEREISFTRLNEVSAK